MILILIWSRYPSCAPKAQLGFPLPNIPSHTLQGAETLPEQLQQHLDVSMSGGIPRKLIHIYKEGSEHASIHIPKMGF